MVSSRSRCLARSRTKCWRHGHRPPPLRVPSSAACAVQPAGYANAIVGLYVGTALLGAVVYLYFKVDIQPPSLERDRHWHALGFFDLKEDFVAIGLGLLPVYWRAASADCR